MARDTASLRTRLVPSMPASSGWFSALLVTVIGAALRLWNLGQPHAVIFDETYYPKDALALLRFGVEQATVSDADKILLKSDGNWHTVDIFSGAASFIVHPPLGKWIIGFDAGHMDDIAPKRLELDLLTPDLRHYWSEFRMMAEAQRVVDQIVDQGERLLPQPDPDEDNLDDSDDEDGVDEDGEDGFRDDSDGYYLAAALRSHRRRR